MFSSTLSHVSWPHPSKHLRTSYIFLSDISKVCWRRFEELSSGWAENSALIDKALQTELGWLFTQWITFFGSGKKKDPEVVGLKCVPFLNPILTNQWSIKAHGVASYFFSSVRNFGKVWRRQTITLLTLELQWYGRDPLPASHSWTVKASVCFKLASSV